MLELWQTEWCPASQRVRQRLTELGIDYVVRQVPVEKEERTALREQTGSDTVPALVDADGGVAIGEDAIRAFLAKVPEPAGAEAHRQKAAKARRRQLEEEMHMLRTRYTLATTTQLGFADAVERVREELATEGFGVLCEIDVQATMKAKLDVDGEPYTILGACNPPLAHRALGADPELGTLLPCNVVVYRRDGQTHVSAIDAERMLSIVGNDDLAPVAAEVRRRLATVVDRVSKV